MFDAETLGDELFLSCHHIFIAIVGESIMQPITRLTGTSKPDRVWQDEVVLGRIEWLIRSERFWHSR